MDHNIHKQTNKKLLRIGSLVSLMSITELESDTHETELSLEHYALYLFVASLIFVFFFVVQHIVFGAKATRISATKAAYKGC